MTDFDPDAYLAEKSKPEAFDPDAYLADKGGAAPSRLTGRFAPGSVDPDEKPFTELPTNFALDPGAYGAHPGEHARTSTQRREKLDADATAGHTDDPGVQAIAGGIMGAGAGSAIGAGAEAAGLGASRLTPVIQATGAGGVANKTQGGDFTTGALLGAGGAAVPLVGRTLAHAAREGAAGTLERSAARAAESATPVRDAADKAVEDIKKHAKGLGAQVAGSELLGHGSAAGHALTGLSVAYNVGRPVVRAAGVAADEGVARILRRLGKARGAAAEATGPLQAAGWLPDLPAEAPPAPGALEPETARAGWSPTPDDTVAGPAAPPPSSLDKAIAAAKEAREGATTKAERDLFDKAIAGYEKRKAAPPRETSPAGEQLAPTLEERAQATRDDRMPPQRAPESEKSIPVEGRPATAPSETPTVAEKGPAKATEFGGRPSNVQRPPPEWKPTKDDEKYAKPMGLTVQAYRDLMTKRASRLGYDEAVKRLARAARATSKVSDFVRQAVSAGVSDADARKMWEAAHPQLEAVR